MSPADLLTLRQRRPFQPFRIQVSDGTTYEVRHPELMMVGLGSVVVGVPAEGQKLPVYEAPIILSLNHVVKLLPIEAEQKAAG